MKTRHLVLSIFLFIVLAGFVFRPFLSKADVATGLIGLWKLDEGSGVSAADSAGSNNGALLNSPTWTPGKISNALLFNGINQTVKTNSLGPTGNPALSASAWIKTTSSAEEVFFAYGSDSGIGSPEYFRLNVNMTGANSLGVRTGNGRRSFNAPSITDGNWHHVVVSKSANDILTNLKIYLYPIAKLI